MYAPRECASRDAMVTSDLECRQPELAKLVSRRPVRRTGHDRARTQGTHGEADVEQPRIRRRMAVEDDQRPRDTLVCVLARQQP